VKPATLLRSWYDAVGADSLTAGELLKRLAGQGAQSYPELAECIAQIRCHYKRFTSASLTHWLRRREGKTFDGYTLASRHVGNAWHWSVTCLDAPVDLGEIDTLADLLLPSVRDDSWLDVEPMPQKEAGKRAPKLRQAEPRLPSWKRHEEKAKKQSRVIATCPSERRAISAALAAMNTTTHKKWSPLDV
jgi:hypothetical protein